MSLRVALISYHKNAERLYPGKWIDEYRYSVENQTHPYYDVWELVYGPV